MEHVLQLHHYYVDKNNSLIINYFDYIYTTSNKAIKFISDYI